MLIDISLRRIRSAWLGSFMRMATSGLSHGQVEQAFLEHQVDLQIGVFLVERGQARREPERAETDRRRDPQFAEDLFLRIADARGGGLQPLGHVTRGVEQKLSLFGQDQAPRVPVKKAWC